MSKFLSAIIHQLAAITFDKELLKKLPAKYWFVNLLQTHFIKNYFRKTACKILLWKELPGNFVPMFPCLCTPERKHLKLGSMTNQGQFFLKKEGVFSKHEKGTSLFLKKS